MKWKLLLLKQTTNTIKEERCYFFNLTIWNHLEREVQWGLPRSGWPVNMSMRVCLGYSWINKKDAVYYGPHHSLGMGILIMSSYKWSALKPQILVTSYKLNSLYLGTCICIYHAITISKGKRMGIWRTRRGMRRFGVRKGKWEIL